MQTAAGSSLVFLSALISMSASTDTRKEWGGVCGGGGGGGVGGGEEGGGRDKPGIHVGYNENRTVQNVVEPSLIFLRATALTQVNMNAQGQQQKKGWGGVRKYEY